MNESSETHEESTINGGDTLELARQCPLLLPVSSEDTIIGHLPENNQNFELKELYALLECDTIEVVYLGDTGMIMIIDEEGALKNEPEFNEFATVMWRHYEPLAAGQHLFGKVLLCPTECLI